MTYQRPPLFILFVIIPLTRNLCYTWKWPRFVVLWMKTQKKAVALSTEFYHEYCWWLIHSIMNLLKAKSSILKVIMDWWRFFTLPVTWNGERHTCSCQNTPYWWTDVAVWLPGSLDVKQRYQHPPSHVGVFRLLAIHRPVPAEAQV